MTEEQKIKMLQDLPFSNRKIIVGRQNGNSIIASGEIRCMSTAGGYQYAIAEINDRNQRGSGRYSTDYEEIYLHSLDTRFFSQRPWYLVEDSEHTINSSY